MTLSRLAWQDAWASPIRMILLCIGVAVGVASLALILGLSAGVESIVMHKVLGVLPDQIVVEPQKTAFGFVQFSSGPALDEAMISKLENLPGVRAVYRQVRIQLPAQIDGEYSGRSFYTDVLVEAIEPHLVETDVPQAGAFAVRPMDQPIPVVLPSAMIDVLNMGLQINTGLPQINPSMLIGRHFELKIGTSSFKPGGPSVSTRCEIVGISPRVFVGGPSIPLGYLPQLDQMLRAQGGAMPPSTASSLTIMLKDPSDVPSVSAAIRELGLGAPLQEKARAVTAVIRGITLMLSLFALVILVVAGTGIGNGMALMVKDESGEIGLFRAVGASRGQIRLLYLLRAAAVGLCGGAAGVAVAAIAAICVNVAADRYVPGLLSGNERVVALSFVHVCAGLAFGLCASLLAGFLPARQAAQLDPAAVLRER